MDALAVEWSDIGHISGVVGGATAWGVSAEGSVVVGATSESNVGWRAFRWEDVK